MSETQKSELQILAEEMQSSIEFSVPKPLADQSLRAANYRRDSDHGTRARAVEIRNLNLQRKADPESNKLVK